MCVYVIFREIIMPIDIGRDLMHMEALIAIMYVSNFEPLRVSPLNGFGIRVPSSNWSVYRCTSQVNLLIYNFYFLFLWRVEFLNVCCRVIGISF